MVNNILICLFLNRWLNSRQFKDGPITVVGMLRSNSGLGKAVRLTLNALKSMKLQLTCFDVSTLYEAYKFTLKLPKTIVDEEGGYIIVQNSAIHLPIILFLLGKKKLHRKKIIGYFAWELEELPLSWIKPAMLVDEIWVPSKFSATAFTKIKHMPKVRVVPHPLNIVNSGHKITLPSEIRKYSKKILNISTLGSQFERKNLLGVISAFKKEYSGSKNVCLILKISGNNLFQKGILIEKIKGEKNIFLMDKNLSEKELYGLIESADLLLSLHRSEGFSLCIAEAMMLQTPVIATNWSANVEFSSYHKFLVDYKKIHVDDPEELSSYAYNVQPQWADPVIEDAAVKIKFLIENPREAAKYSTISYNAILDFLNGSQSFIYAVKNSLSEMVDGV